jgi:trehalose synthase
MKGRISLIIGALLILCTIQFAFPQREAWCQAPHDADAGYIQWLEQNSMLYQAEVLSKRYSGSGVMWQHPYALPQPRKAAACASVWFTAYPASTITRDGESVLRTLGDENLWKMFSDIGIRAMHTGPMKRAGGIKGRDYTPTIDGNFDRISMSIDPAFGTDDEYKTLTRVAGTQRAIIIGDVIPGHTGKGADFRLAERNVKDYPGIYHMVRIDEKDWALLPHVAKGRDSVNLSAVAVEELKKKGYIVGLLTRTIFYEPGIKDTDWSATDIVTGADGVKRRWVYLHYFKDGQPTMNWLDPSFAAERLLIGDMLSSMTVLGEKMLRLDANGFLGIEKSPSSDRAWSEGHPLSVTSNEIITMMARKLGGFTFQELNLTLEDIKAMSAGGADLSYDFVTRPAYHHALVTGDARFLRLMLGLMEKYRIDPAGLIHALQNHDELTLELVHFWTGHSKDVFHYRGKDVTGSELRDDVRSAMYSRLIGPGAPYNLKASNGVSCTTASLCAAALGIKDPYRMTEKQKEEVKRLHLLLVMFNAFQPGVMAISGWDLVGALTLPADQVKALLADGDTRWINRGAYDLMGTNPGATKSGVGLPKAQCLYGSLPEQMINPESFARKLKMLLKIREDYKIAESDRMAVCEVKNPALLVMVQRLPEKKGIEITALNFGREKVEESVSIRDAAGHPVVDLLAGKPALPASAKGEVMLSLEPCEGKALLIKDGK